MIKTTSKTKRFWASGVALFLVLASCQSGANLTVKQSSGESPTVNANLTPLTTGGWTVRLSKGTQLPERLRLTSDLNVSVDNSKTIIPVMRNADGSYTFTIPATTRIDTTGKLKVIFIADRNSSEAIMLDTGPLLKLNSPAILTNPSPASLAKGLPITLTANLVDAEQAKAFSFNWSSSTSPQGPFTPISGNGPSVDWTPQVSGNYYVRIEINQRDEQLSSSYVTATPLVSVADADDAIITTPSPANLLKGANVKLKAAIPGTEGKQLSYSWSYAGSAQGPWSAIPDAQTSEVDWTPSNSGSFYLKVDMSDAATGRSFSYTSSKSVVVVSESSDSIRTTPSPATISLGSSITLDSALPGTGTTNRTYTWSYGTSAQGPWQAINNGRGASIQWTPTLAGNYFVKLDVTESDTGKSFTYISPREVAFVSQSADTIKTNPSPAILNRGFSTTLLADIPNTDGKNLSYTWSSGLTSQGPWTPINAQGQGQQSKGRQITWTPSQEGNYYVKVDVFDQSTGSITQFVSPNTLVFVNEQRPLFATSPNPANITTDSGVTIEAYLPNTLNVIYAWSYSPSSVGPWTAIGGSSLPKIEWNKPPLPGSYYVKVDVINRTDGTVTPFVSKAPLVFVDPPNTDRSTFGTF